MRDWTLSRAHETPSGVVRWDRFGAGPPVVLLHGTPFSSFVWRELLRALSHRYEVYVWDMPGYGRSQQKAGQDVSLRAQAEVFASLLQLWGLAEPAVVAHDFGGAVSLRAHLLHGARYRRLVLADAVVLSPWGSPFFRLVARHPDTFEELPSNLHAALVREYVSTASAHGLTQAVLDELVRPWLGGEGQAAFYRQIAQADQRHTDEIEQLLPRLELPVLVCWGSEDTWLPPRRGRELAARIPGAVLRPLQGAGHLVQYDAPAQLAAAVTEFLSG